MAHRRFCKGFCKLEMIWTIPIKFPMHRSSGSSLRFYQDTLQNPKRRRPLCVKDWWLLNHQSKTYFAFVLVVLTCPWDVVEHRHEDNPSSERLWCFTQISTVTLEFCCRAAMWWILGRYSARIPLAHHKFCPKLCILVNFSTTSTCLPMHTLIGGSRSSFLFTKQNLRIRPVCKRLVTFSSPTKDNYFHGESSQLIVFTP